MSDWLPASWWGLGGSFGPKENNIVQTSAAAAGGMSSAFVSAFPALYQLGLMKTPAEDYTRIASITLTAGLFAFFFATPRTSNSKYEPYLY